MSDAMETVDRATDERLRSGHTASVTASDHAATAPAVDPSIDTTFRRLRNLNVSELDSAELHEAMRILRPMRGWMDHLDASLRHRAHHLATSSGLSDPAGDTDQITAWGESISDCESLNHESGITSREGRRRDARARVLSQFPDLAQHLCDGRITSDHIDAVADISRTADTDIRGILHNYSTEIISAVLAHDPAKLRRVLAQLITRIAADLGVERTARQRRARFLRHWMDVNGMGRISAQLDPDTYQRFAAILGTATQRARHHSRSSTSTNRFEPGQDQTGQQPFDHGHLNIDTLMELVTAGSEQVNSESQGHRRGVSMSVIIDVTTLMEGLHAASICEYADGTPIDLAQARQLACEAQLLPVVLRGASMPLDVGRSQRTATSHQQTALQAIYATCAVPACTTAVTQCEIHHIRRWEHGGRTDLSNLLPLCGYHHHVMHRERWKLNMDEQRHVLIVLPDGTTLSGGPDRLTDFAADPHQQRLMHQSQNLPVVMPATPLRQQSHLDDQISGEPPPG